MPGHSVSGWAGIAGIRPIPAIVQARGVRFSSWFYMRFAVLAARNANRSYQTLGLSTDRNRSDRFLGW